MFLIFQFLFLFLYLYLYKITYFDDLSSYSYYHLSASKKSLCFNKSSLLFTFPLSSKSNGELFMQDINKCMENPIDKTYLPTNTEEAYSHYQSLNHFFESYSYIKRPAYCGCKGPYLENEFIRRFKPKPLSYFSPFIPLFFPFFGVFQNLSTPNYSVITRKMIEQLKPNYLYFVLSESDWGFLVSSSFFRNVPRNIFIFSASGMGHVAIPWINCDAQPSKTEIKKEYLLSFCGRTKTHQIRGELLKVATDLLGSDFYVNYSQSWKDIFYRSKFVLSPRGIAVNTYRTYEILRMEEIPVIVTDRFHWLPYYPRLNWCKFSFLTTLQDFPSIVNRLKNMSDDDYNQMKNTLHYISKRYFQWDGIFEQIDMFFNSSAHSFSCSKGSLTY